jgi:HD-GYP domain-containing protein (c-di-GMP phosphodiesterase class II)
MRIVYLPAVSRSGLTVGRSIKHASGAALVRAKTPLTRCDIASLGRCGIQYLYVMDDANPDARPTEVIPPYLRDQAVLQILAVHQSAARAARSGDEDFDSIPVLKVARDLVGITRSCPRLMHDLLSIHPLDEFTAWHSVGSALLAVMTGMACGLGADEITALAMAMLVHDVGMAHVPTRIYGKPGPLTAVEREVIQEHPKVSARCAKLAGMPALAVEAIRSHHEAWDGSGYPDGLAGSQISPVAQVAAAVEAYDALTSPRPYAHPVLPSAAAAWLLQERGRLFAPDAVAGLLKHLAVYPAGLTVQLNTYEIAVVIRTTIGSPSRPMVRLLCDERGVVLCEPVEVDLMTCPSRSIVQPLLDHPLSIPAIDADNAPPTRLAA